MFRGGNLLFLLLQALASSVYYLYQYKSARKLGKFRFSTLEYHLKYTSPYISHTTFQVYERKKLSNPPTRLYSSCQRFRFPRSYFQPQIDLTNLSESLYKPTIDITVSSLCSLIPIYVRMLQRAICIHQSSNILPRLKTSFILI